MPKKFETSFKFITTFQILTNDVQMLIMGLSYFITTVLRVIVLRSLFRHIPISQGAGEGFDHRERRIGMTLGMTYGFIPFA